MVHVPYKTRKDFFIEQAKNEMLQVQYVDLGDGSDPFVLGTTDWPIHVQCIRNPAWLVS